jgi:methionyl-tRNA formyltransferase
MRIAFLGSGPLGLPTLRALAASPEHEIVTVVTQPDRPAGRGLQPRPTPVKVFARGRNLPLFQPEVINREVDRLRHVNPDVIVVVAFGQILSQELLEVPRLGAVNLHASLLPKYRGAAPIQWALIRGERVTGVTTFLLDEGLDTGPILLQREVPISEEDTAGTLEGKLSEIGAEVMLETLRGLQESTITPIPQDDARATYAPKIKKEMAKIDWTADARSVFNLIRALEPSPGAYTFYRGRRLKIRRGRVVDEETRRGEPGEVVALGTEGPIVQTGQGLLELTAVQPEGRKVMSGLDFTHGYRVQVGEKLGDRTRD